VGLWVTLLRYPHVHSRRRRFNMALYLIETGEFVKETIVWLMTNKNKMMPA
jgi:hypothetical protein